MSAVNPPDAPPARPTIPEGLATKLGKFGGPLVIVCALIADQLGIDFDTESTVGVISGIAMLLTTMLGRYWQAAALYRDAPSPMSDVSGENDDIAGDEFVGPDDGTSPVDADKPYEPEGAVRGKPGAPGGKRGLQT